ncbi:MAG TPA: hypothetical protein HA309_01690, partial [Candidatus Thalassarchaeaceae archaeon]|nr:hypothetical protein [Candidatus Thalassarchaeaceae archaeon]|tara:strand:+ start:582 stop:983 length:402 start_codon:yes stop_codon:yes gene_type:complete
VNSPSQSAENLIIGLGIVLLLATAFALIDGRLPPAECPVSTSGLEDVCTSSSVIGWLIPGTAVLCLALGISSRMAHNSGRTSFLDRFFTNESESEIAKRVSADYEDEYDTDRLSGAWANMEAKMLESTHSEEE